MPAHQVGLHEESVMIIKKYSRDGETLGDAADRLLKTADSRKTALQVYYKKGKKPSKAKAKAKQAPKARKVAKA